MHSRAWVVQQPNEACDWHAEEGEEEEVRERESERGVRREEGVGTERERGKTRRREREREREMIMFDCRRWKKLERCLLLLLFCITLEPRVE